MDEKGTNTIKTVLTIIAAALIITGIVLIAVAIGNAPSISDPFNVFGDKMELMSALSFAGIGCLAGGSFLMAFSRGALHRGGFSGTAYSASSPTNASGFQPTPQPVFVKEVIREIVKVKCPFCGVLVEITSSVCPNCGGTVH